MIELTPEEVATRLLDMPERRSLAQSQEKRTAFILQKKKQARDEIENRKITKECML
jgi:hypothetical protein